MNTVLDEGFVKLVTPAQAEKHYLPKVIAEEKDLTEVRRELKEIHNFSEEDIRIAARVISNAQFEYIRNKKAQRSGWVGVIAGCILGVIRVMSWIFLQQHIVRKPILIIVPLGIGGAGFLMFFRAIQHFK